MKRIALLSIVLILSISLISCSSNTAGLANAGTEKQQATAQADPSGSNSIEAEQTEGSSIDVQGENTALSFHSLDFIDENTGWVVEGAYQSDRQGSRLLMTQDGGKNWEKTELDNMTLERVKFVDKTTGWAIAQAENKNTSGAQTYTMKILNTADGGKSWDVQWEKEMDSTFDCDLWFADSTHGYALVGGTVLSTVDGGKQWSAVALGVSNFIPQHMSFVDADKGWLIGKIESNPDPPSYAASPKNIIPL